MATKTLTADRSSAFLHRISDGLETGAGQDDHLPMHVNWTGYRERSWIDWPVTSSFWADMASVSKVELGLRTTGGGVHVGRGSSPGFWIRRAVEQAHPNNKSMDGGGSATTDPDTYPGPEARSGDQVWATYGNTSSELDVLYDITDMAREWMPTSIPGGRGGLCYGVRLDQGDSTNDGAEVYSAEATSSKRPFLRVTYVPKSEAVPRAPSLVIPVGVKVNATRFDFTSADALTSYDLQVSTSKTFAPVTHWNLVTSTASLAGDGKSVAVAYGGLALSADPVVYWWRARGRNAYGAGAWSAAASFTSDPAATAKDQLDRWAATILEALAQPRRQVLLGQLIPEGDQVADITGTSPGGRWRVTDAGHGALVDRVVEMVGVSLSADASGWYVDVVTHDLGPAGGSTADYPVRVTGGYHAPPPFDYWQLGEAAGTFANTMPARAAIVGTAVGSLLRAQAPLAGTDGCVSSTNFGQVTFGNIHAQPAEYTVMAWVVWNGTGEVYLWEKLQSSPLVGWRLQVTTTGALRSLVGDQAGVVSTVQSAAGVVVPWRAVHVTFTRTAANLVAMYLDGRPIHTGSHTTWAGYIPAQVARVLMSGGSIDELGMWQSALTADQVDAIYRDWRA